MTSKLKKMGYILCVGTTLVFLGSIGIYNSGPEMAGIWKTILIAILAIFLIGLSFVAKKSFKLDKFDNYILTTGFFTLVCGYVSIGEYELFGKWFSFHGEGLYIFLASIAILIAILCLIMKVKTKAFAFYELAYTCLAIAIYDTVMYFTGDYYIAALVIPSMLLIGNLISLLGKGFSAFPVITFISIFMTIMYIGEKDTCYGLIFTLINLVSIFVSTRKYKNNDMLILPILGLGFNTLFTFCTLEGLFDNSQTASVISSFIVVIYDLLFIPIGGSEKRGYNIFAKIVVTFFLFISCMYTKDNLVTGLFVYVFIIVTSLVSTFVIKSDTFERHLLPYKSFMVIQLLCMHLTNYIGIDFALGHIVCNLACISILIFSKDKYLIGELLSLVFITLLRFAFNDGSILFFVIGMTIVLFDYIAMFYLTRRYNTDHNRRTFFILMLFYILFLVVRVDFNYYKYLICAGAYTVLYIFSYKDKMLAGFSLGFIVGSLLLYSYSISGYQLSLYSMIIFGGIFAFGYSIFEDKKSRDSFISVASIAFVILSGFASIYFAIIELSFAVIYLTECVTLLIYSNVVNDKYLFNVSMIATAFIICRLLFTIEGIPTAVVITVTGIIIIIVLSVMIKNYIKKEQDKDIKAEKAEQERIAQINAQINQGPYCGHCGAKVSLNDDTCPSCFNVIREEVKFCGQCGAKLKKNDTYCPECGDAIKR